MPIAYQFLPWVRRGLARAVQAADTPAAAARPQISVGLTLQAREHGQSPGVVSGQIDLSLYGPGDVIGIDPRLVVRTEPRAGTRNFEPNYLAAIDFDPPDFPWMMTPLAATGQRLRPWLVLVVLRSTAATQPRLQPGAPLPSLSLTAEQVVRELPDLTDAALWAHGQAVSAHGADAVSQLDKELQQRPERNVSRLVCPRRLEPGTAYIACVVPAFEVGRLRGLGRPVAADATLAPAWNHAQPNATELPVYHHWSFGTGPVGDIESLARRIRTPDKYAHDTALRAQLGHIGEMPVAVDADHLLFDGPAPGRTLFEGALVSLGFQPDKVDMPSASKLQAMLDSGPALTSAGSPQAARAPTLSPPLYGAYPARRHQVQLGLCNTRWLDQLNLQPRYRLAAGWGAEIVRRHQDEFMQAAWEQVGEVLAAERAFSLSRLARDVLKAVERRHLARLPEHRLLAVLAPARGRLQLGVAESLFGRIENSTLPAELFDGAMRRFSAPTRPALRLARWRTRDAVLPSPAQQLQNLFTQFADASQHLARIDPNRFVPDGLQGSRSFDAIPMPADLTQSIDLKEYLGVEGSITGAELQQLRTRTAAAREAAERAKPAPAQLGDIWTTGILTEVHRRRLRELQSVSGQPLDMAAVEKLLQQASKSRVDGVLVSVSASGRVNAQGLQLQAASGQIQRAGALLGPQPSDPGRAPSARTAQTLAQVPLLPLHQYGLAALWSSMPVDTLGRGSAVVELRFHKGRFAPASEPAPPVPSDRVHTVTLPPLEKRPAVLARYAQAFRDYHGLKESVQQSRSIAVAPVDLARAQTVAQVRARLDPAHTVPQRLATTLTLGGQAVAFDAARGLVGPALQTRLDLALAPNLRLVTPVAWDRVMAYPHLTMPLSRKLERIAPEVFLPGVGVLPDDFIMAVSTNPRFVEALMLGANHEMGRELLWQGFPTDQRGTPLRHFWQRLDGATDIDPIHQWGPRPLGGQPGSTPMLVLLLRGQLLERFPHLSIYAYPKAPNDKRPGGDSPAEMDPNAIERPVLRGHLGSDITYVGFGPRIRPEESELRNWFFVLEEHMTEPRFGFDDPDGPRRQGPGWMDVDWSEVGVAAGQCFSGADLRRAPPARSQPDWTEPHAALVAEALLQRPFRGYYAGSKLVPR